MKYFLLGCILVGMSACKTSATRSPAQVGSGEYTCGVLQGSPTNYGFADDLNSKCQYEKPFQIFVLNGTVADFGYCCIRR